MLTSLFWSLGSAHGSHDNVSFTLRNTVHLRQGTSDGALLSVTVGLPYTNSLFFSYSFIHLNEANKFTKNFLSDFILILRIQERFLSERLPVCIE